LSSLYEHTKGLTPLVILVKSTCFSSSTPVRDYSLLEMLCRVESLTFIDLV
jgi:hypothetical protein